MCKMGHSLDYYLLPAQYEDGKDLEMPLLLIHLTCLGKGVSKAGIAQVVVMAIPHKHTGHRTD